MDYEAKISIDIELRPLVPYVGQKYRFEFPDGEAFELEAIAVKFEGDECTVTLRRTDPPRIEGPFIDIDSPSK